jgi:phospholipid-translocating ATPase
LAWREKFNKANQSLSNRETEVRKIIESLEVDMEFLGITGVEDKLQEDVCNTLENLRNAGIQVWMLTGDKVETATCIAISAGIKSTAQDTFLMKELVDPIEITNKLNDFSNMYNKVLIIDGGTLAVALDKCRKAFFESACKAPSVVCCRCSPTQKALVTEGIKQYTQKKTCAVGDGGNDVGMIQAADVGIGIEGKEGKQAALAADFSILKFRYLARLFLWHGRLSYKRSSVLSQFVIHRGLTISVIQFLFSCIFYSLSIPIYGGVLMLGYSTVFTMFPVFCLVINMRSIN